jgi:hypothetical protein
MKTPLISLALVLTSVTAFGAQKPTTMHQLKADVGQAVKLMEAADGCSFTMKETRTGITLKATDDKRGSVYMDIADDAKILLNDRSKGEDGDVIYSVRGEGSFELQIASDAFDAIKLTDREGKTVSCEVDF